MALGIPFCLGADWQVTPAQLESSGLPRLLSAVIVAPGTRTNTKSGNEIDYFLVSATLASQGYTVTTSTRCSFEPHLPVIMDLNVVKGAQRPVRRLVQPKLLPVYRIMGPLPAPTLTVDWENWQAIADARKLDKPDDTVLTQAAVTWAAGAEVELMAAIGITGDDVVAHMGIGMPPRFIDSAPARRFRCVADELGLTGHWMTWASRGLKMVETLGVHVAGTRMHDQTVDEARRMARRAPSLRAALLRLRPREGEDEYRNIGADALRMLSRTANWKRGRPPLIFRASADAAHDELAEVAEFREQLARAIEALASARNSRARKDLRRWAKSADDRTAHRVTKTSEAVFTKTASSSKTHRGEATSQEAADGGLQEWSASWLGCDTDGGDDIDDMVNVIYDATRLEQDNQECAQPPCCPERVRWMASRLRGATGLGSDFTRPSHVGLLSLPARRALTRLYEVFEHLRRWPHILRLIIEIALAKKTGGSRLIGLATAVFRLWAKCRYADCRAVMEERVARTYLPAAPGRGALSAAFDLSFDAEAAAARGESAATTCFDLRQYFERITMHELAQGAKRHGLPKPIIALLLQVYSGPRRVRVGQAHSVATYPRRSVLAGCTFALLLVRIITIDPMDVLLAAICERLKGWDARISTSLYVDDGVVTTYGSTDAVIFLHQWITRLVLDWIAKVLCKEIAAEKLICIVSPPTIRNALTPIFRPLGIPTTLEGELLGTDYAAGGVIRRKTVQNKRRYKAVARKGKLKWWRRVGGNARKVAKAGAQPTIAYGASITGLSNAALRDTRRVLSAAVAVQCGGASAAAKLATGGDDHADYDPHITLCNPPMEGLLQKVWDHTACRADFVRSWYAARADAASAHSGSPWNMIRGPVGAAWLHCVRSGATWCKPFLVHALDHDVNLLTTPPKQVMAILRAHARRQEDRLMLARLAQRFSWDADAVMAKYTHGIDWWLVRRMLNGNIGDLLPAERRILAVVTAGGFWPEHRRYHCGLRNSPLCDTCNLEDGTPQHRLHDCGAMANDIILGIAGGHIPRLPQEAREPAYAPLLEMGLPPRAVPWQPIVGNFVEGSLSMDPGGNRHTYGDGSGFNQQSVESRVATWAVIRAGNGDNGNTVATETMRGIVDGWYPTVPRGELSALNAHIQHAGLNDTYVGDCRHVLDGIEKLVPISLTSSANINADLWGETKRLLRDHGGAIAVRKTKAHRSRARAEVDLEDTLQNWLGNNLADAAAKDLARDAAISLGNAAEVDRERDLAIPVIKRVAYGAAWAYRHWPAIDGRAARPSDPDIDIDEANDEGHVIKRRLDGTYECSVCRKTARTPAGGRRLLHEACGGNIRHRIDETHALHHTKGITWCNNCGAYTTRWPRRLLHKCDRRPRTAVHRTILKRLRAGLPPMDAPHFQIAAKEDEGRSGNIEDPHPETTGRYARLPAEKGLRDLRWRCTPCNDPLLPPGMLPAVRPCLPWSRTKWTAATGHDATVIDGNRLFDRSEPASLMDPTRLKWHSECLRTAEPPAPGEACSRPTVATAWTRWIVTERLAEVLPCDARPSCSNTTRSRCRSCKAPLCMRCIREGRQCVLGKSLMSHSHIEPSSDLATCNGGPLVSARTRDMTVDNDDARAGVSPAARNQPFGHQQRPQSAGDAANQPPLADIGPGPSIPFSDIVHKSACPRGDAEKRTPFSRTTMDYDDGGLDRHRSVSLAASRLQGESRVSTCSRHTAKSVVTAARSASPVSRASAKPNGRARSELLARLRTMGNDHVYEGSQPPGARSSSDSSGRLRAIFSSVHATQDRSSFQLRNVPRATDRHTDDNHVHHQLRACESSPRRLSRPTSFVVWRMIALPIRTPCQSPT